MWMHRPRTAQDDRWLQKLGSDRKARAMHLWHFRRRWGLRSGLMPRRDGLSQDMFLQRVASIKIMFKLDIASFWFIILSVIGCYLFLYLQGKLEGWAISQSQPNAYTAERCSSICVGLLGCCAMLCATMTSL
jgi:hypothetical protein